MAIFHCEVKSISRSDGRTATAAASYRAGAKIKDEKTQTQYDYTKKRNVISAHIVLPSEIELKINRADLWNKAEYAEKRKDAKVAREYEIALPAELPLDAQRQLAITFAQTIADRFHVAADVAIHKPDRRGDERNVHAHILTTTRRINDKGELTEKTRELDTKPTSAKHVEAIREIWADLCNKELERYGRSERIDHRTLEAQGIDRAPQIHVGVHATQMERRGIPTERGEANRRIIAANKHIDGLKAELSKVENTIAELKQQRKQREQEKAEQAAAAARAQAEEKARLEAIEREKQERQAAERKAQEEQRKRQEKAAAQQQPKAKQPHSPTQKPVEGAKVEKTTNDTPKPQEGAKKAVIEAEQAKQPKEYYTPEEVREAWDVCNKTECAYRQTLKATYEAKISELEKERSEVVKKFEEWKKQNPEPKKHVWNTQNGYMNKWNAWNQTKIEFEKLIERKIDWKIRDANSCIAMLNRQERLSDELEKKIEEHVKSTCPREKRITEWAREENQREVKRKSQEREKERQQKQQEQKSRGFDITD